MQPISEIAIEDDPAALALGTETASAHHCEGRVVTCAHCGRPASECGGEDCAHVLETRDWMVPGYSTTRA